MRQRCHISERIWVPLLPLHHTVLLPSWFVRLLVQLQFSCPCVLCILYTHFGSSTHNKHTPQCERPRTRTWARQRQSEWTAQHSTHILTAYSAQSPNQIYRYSIFIHESGREKYNNNKNTHTIRRISCIFIHIFILSVSFISFTLSWLDSLSRSRLHLRLLSQCVCAFIFFFTFFPFLLRYLFHSMHLLSTQASSFIINKRVQSIIWNET